MGEREWRETLGPTVSVGKSVNGVGQCIKHELFFLKYTFFYSAALFGPIF